MDCDRIARAYRWLEYLAFGSRLERHRFHFLPQTRGARQALLLGDGDGRFLTALALYNDQVKIDSIEASAEMTRLALTRVQANRVADPWRIQFIQADALEASLPANHYDLIVTQFFLDCLTTVQAGRLVEAVRAACRSGAQWIISDFEQPRKGWRALHARVWLGVMYWFFGVATGLEARRLPKYGDAMEAAGFRLEGRCCGMAGMICSELWRLHHSTIATGSISGDRPDWPARPI